MKLPFFHALHFRAIILISIVYCVVLLTLFKSLSLSHKQQYYKRIAYNNIQYKVVTWEFLKILVNLRKTSPYRWYSMHTRYSKRMNMSIIIILYYMDSSNGYVMLFTAILNVQQQHNIVAAAALCLLLLPVSSAMRFNASNHGRYSLQSIVYHLLTPSDFFTDFDWCHFTAIRAQRCDTIQEGMLKHQIQLIQTLIFHMSLSLV